MLEEVIDVQIVERVLRRSFQDRRLLREALVHSSYLNEHPDATSESNERLEFLGDALLDLVIGEEVYRRFSKVPEGDLTLLRSTLVRGDALARVAASLDLGQHLLLGQGEEVNGGRTRPSNLAGAFEAVVGAFYLDQGYEAAKGMILELMAGEIERLVREGVPKDPKSQLQECVQKEGKGSPHYRTVEEHGPEHAKWFVVEVDVGGKVLGRGHGRRKAEAEREAAEVALAQLSVGQPSTS
ncbi:MAG: ribonuclease III [Chloroflexi bacterium]|nr:ribonuclease III [Chloroflexota bacterium]